MPQQVLRKRANVLKYIQCGKGFSTFTENDGEKDADA